MITNVATETTPCSHTFPCQPSHSSQSLMPRLQISRQMITVETGRSMRHAQDHCGCTVSYVTQPWATEHFLCFYDSYCWICSFKSDTCFFLVFAFKKNFIGINPTIYYMLVLAFCLFYWFRVWCSCVIAERFLAPALPLCGFYFPRHTSQADYRLHIVKPTDCTEANGKAPAYLKVIAMESTLVRHKSAKFSNFKIWKLISYFIYYYYYTVDY